MSLPALLERRSDDRFRRLVYDLLTIASRMTTVREHLGERMGISAPQYSLLMAVGQFQGERGVGVTAVAKVLHVSSAFVATESGKLAQAGLLAKRANPKDGRAVLLSLTRAGRYLIARHSAEIRAINDIFFGTLTPPMFASLHRPRWLPWSAARRGRRRRFIALNPSSSLGVKRRNSDAGSRHRLPQRAAFVLGKNACEISSW